MSADLLLSWVSERSEGTLAAFRNAHDWLHGEGGPPWTRTLNDLQSLGHLDVDWVGRRWSSVPPALAVLDDAGGHALLTGSRPRWLEDRLDRLDEDPDPEVRALADEVLLVPPVRASNGPSVRYVTYETWTVLSSLAERLGIRALDRPADRLAATLPDLNTLLRPGRGRPLPGGFQVSRMSDVPGPLFRETESLDEPGAYEFHAYGGHRFFYRHSAAEAFEADKGVVVYAELRRRGQHVLHWEPEHRWLIVPARMRLPLPHDRALVLRTGLLPDYQSDIVVGRSRLRLANVLRYRHVDRRTALAVTASLGQILQEIA